MRRFALLMVLGAALLASSVLAAETDTSDGSTTSLLTGQDLAAVLMEWDGYDFVDAGEAFPGGLRSGPSASADPNDPYGADGTVVILPPLEDPAHVLVKARLSSVASPAFWDNTKRVMTELGVTMEDQGAVFATLGRALGQAYDLADDTEQAYQYSVDADPFLALWQTETDGFEAADPALGEPVFAMPAGGVTLEIASGDDPTTVLPTPTPTATPVRTPRPAPTRSPRPAPTRSPRPGPTRSPRPSASPRTPPTAPPPTDFDCSGTSTSIEDPLSRGWNIRRVDWSRRGTFDRVIVTLDRYRALGGNGTQAIVHVMPIDEVESTLKVEAPSEGDTAIALGLFQDVRLTWSLDRVLTTPAIHAITMGKDDNDFPWIVLGVDDGACYQLQVPAWTASNPRNNATIQVTVDVER